MAAQRPEDLLWSVRVAWRTSRSSARCARIRMTSSAASLASGW